VREIWRSLRVHANTPSTSSRSRSVAIGCAAGGSPAAPPGAPDVGNRCVSVVAEAIVA
jgi:hypothetical protein